MRPAVELDAFVVMPNHMHGTIVIHDDDGATRHSHDGTGGKLTHGGSCYYELQKHERRKNSVIFLR
jgi:REP element-mobilizing transposase RayT